MTKAPKKKRGRPALPPGEGKRVPLSMRTTRELRARLDEAVKASGRSLVQEVEYRIECSFLHEDADHRASDAVLAGVYGVFGGEQKYRLMRSLSLVISVIEKRGGGAWDENVEVNEMVNDAIEAFIRRRGPKGVKSASAGHFEGAERRRRGEKFLDELDEFTEQWFSRRPETAADQQKPSGKKKE